MKMTDEHKAAMIAGRKASTSVRKQSSNEAISVSELEVLKRASIHLPSSELTLKKAFSGQSKSMGIKAKCIECSNLQKIEVAGCLVRGCPLWRYRPYRGGK